ncbi:MAG: type I secretion system permease/ATPase [Gammaproteobacteria bacterium]
MAHTVQETPAVDSGLSSLVLVARFLGLPADPGQLRHRFARSGATLSSEDLVRAGRFLGLKARRVASNIRRLSRTPLPAIARHRDGRYLVVAGVAEDAVLVHDPGASGPRSLPKAAFDSAWTGELILMARQSLVRDASAQFGFRWFIPVIVKYRALFGEVLLASFFIQVLALTTPVFFQVVIDKVLVHRAMATLDVLAVGLVLVGSFEVLLGGLRTYLFAHTTNRVDVELGAQLFRHLLALPLSYFQARRVGDSVARVRELEAIRSFITGSSLTVVIDLSFTLVFLVVMYVYSPRLTAVVLATLPFYLLLSVAITPVLRARVQEKFNRSAENQSFLVESVSEAETIKAMALEPQLQRRWEEQLAGYVRSSFRSANLGNVASQAAGLINKISVVLILWVGARAVMAGELSVGQLVAFNMLATRVSGPLLRLVQLWQDFQQAGVSIGRLGDILNTPPEPRYQPGRAPPRYQPGRAPLPTLEGRVTFSEVTFRYQPRGADVLRGLSLEVQAGQVIGIVGPSGSGKSTIARLLQRLYVPDSGRVSVDGVDLALIDASWLRRHVGVVLQDSRLFSGTVHENIALSDPGMPMAAVVRAARLAGAHEFIGQLPEGYDTPVGEQGTRLSGGQRQRIALARTLAADPRVLVLDEATSALDYESELAIQRNLGAICKGRTVIIIAHRLSALRGVDRVVVLDAGRIVEDGAPATLIAHGGRFARLYACQNGGRDRHGAGQG